MKFDNAAKKNIFPSLEKSLSMTTRKDLFSKNQQYLLLLKEGIIEKFDSVHMYIINDFLDESKFEVSSLDVLFEMSNREFDSFVDSGMLFEYFSDNVNYFFSVDESFFLYNKEKKQFIKTKLQIDNKIAF